VVRIRKYGWKTWILVVGILPPLFLIGVILPTKANAQVGVLVVATPSVPVIQPTPTVDATVTALNKQKLVEDVEEKQQTLENWWWSNAAAFFSSLALGIAGFFTLLRYLRDQRSEREKLREEHQAALERRAEERFQSVVGGLGDEREGAQIGAAILLRTFLRSGYEQFYMQTFDLAVANLRRRGISKAALPLTTLDQALIIVFKEAFPLARDQEKKEPASLDATGIQLGNAYLVGANLKQIWGPQAFLQEANLVGANLVGANLVGANLVGADLSGADLSSANLNDANLVGAYLSSANLVGANLVGANLNGANLNGANLNGANLSSADLNGANLVGADLGGANLNGANLNYANLFSANLNKADLNDANLVGADLSSADLSSADLNGANLSSADLSKAIGLTNRNDNISSQSSLSEETSTETEKGN
jgi:uncharacterized protein YjbI with pentapeptide repeats